MKLCSACQCCRAKVGAGAPGVLAAAARKAQPVVRILRGKVRLRIRMLISLQCCSSDS